MQMNFLSVENSQFIADYSWNCGGKLFTFDTPKVMAIVNCTPDSFYNKSRTEHNEDWASLIDKHLSEGADIIDIGGYSTRPGAKDVDIEEEWNRIQPVLGHIKKIAPNVLISVDTFRSEIVHRACNEGADVINDISAGMLDENMFREVAYKKAPIILMHMKGTATDMMSDTSYNNLVAEVVQHLSFRAGKAREAGIVDIAIDPGFCFSKNVDQNYLLMNNLEHLHLIEAPVLCGIS